METLTPLPRPSGWFFSLAATWLVLVSLVASLLRADPMPLWRDLRVDTWAYLILLAAVLRAVFLVELYRA